MVVFIGDFQMNQYSEKIFAVLDLTDNVCFINVQKCEKHYKILNKLALEHLIVL
jgi:hypothetical protein